MAEARATTTKPKARIRRLVGLPLLALLGMAALHGTWAWHPGRALDQPVEVLRAAGERVLPANFDHKRGTNASMYDNAARDLKAAAVIAADESDEAATLTWVAAPPPPPPPPRRVSAP